MRLFLGLVLAAGLFVFLKDLLEPKSHLSGLKRAREWRERERRPGILVRLGARIGGETRWRLGILGRSPSSYLTESALAAGAGALLFALFFRIWGVPFGLAAGWAFRRWALGRELVNWQERTAAGIPDLANFLEINLGAGETVPAALAGSAGLLEEPLAGEVQRLLGRIGTEGRQKALGEFAERIQNPDARAVLARIRHVWESGASPGLFADLAANLDRLRELEAEVRAERLPVFYTILPAVGLVNLAILAGVPALTLIARSLG